jgi:uncharacterized membrane protein (DUF485 family)
MQLQQQDWEAIEASPEFRRLVVQRRRFVIAALAVFVVCFGGFLILSAWDADFMASTIVSGFSVAYAYALGLIVMTWAIAWAYLRFAGRTLDAAAERVVEFARAREGGRGAPPPAGPRIEPQGGSR